VGLDVVRTAVVALGGDVQVQSGSGEGTRVRLVLPVTLGIARALVVRAAGERWAVPLSAVLETVPLGAAGEQEAAGVRVLVRRGATMPVLDLAAAVGAPGRSTPAVALVVRGADGATCAWAVDAVESERETVVKELGAFLGRRDAVLGATVDDEGRVVSLLDLRALVPVRMVTAPAPAAGPAPPQDAVAPEPGGQRGAAARSLPLGGTPRVLVVEDSVGVRELARSVLEGAGFAVSTAVDGLDGAARLGLPPVDLVVTDVEMPGMDGFTLTRTLRATRGWEHVPVVVLTSRGSSADRDAGLAAGADAYLLKSDFSPRTLVDTVHDLLAARRAPLTIDPHPAAPAPPTASSGRTP
jgi:CheY-like chemotaxis protein